MLWFLLIIIAFFSLFSSLNSHVYFKNPPTRAKCFYETPISISDDTTYRGNPCGRKSQGIIGAIVAGEHACLVVRVSVAHPSVFRFSITSGTVGIGGKEDGYPTFTTIFDHPRNIFAEFNCESIPGGCRMDPGGRGDYQFPVLFPNYTLDGVYTIQIRQYASEFNWYYYDCADIMVFRAFSDIPNELLKVWQDLNRTCDLNFQAINYPNPVYSQEGFLFGSFGILALFFICGNMCWIYWHYRQNIKGQSSAPSSTPSTPNVAYESLSTFTRTEISRCRIYILLQVILVVCGFVSALAVDFTWRTCSYRPSPVFGP